MVLHNNNAYLILLHIMQSNSDSVKYNERVIYSVLSANNWNINSQ